MTLFTPIQSREEKAAGDGRGYSVFSFSASVAAGKSRFLRITTPADPLVRLDIHSSYEGEGLTRLMDSNSFGAAGTALTNVNWNRRCGSTSSVVVQAYETNTNIVSTGSVLWEGYSPGNAQGNQEIGGSLRSHGYLAAGSEEYLIEVTNREGTAKNIETTIHWEEDG